MRYEIYSFTLPVHMSLYITQSPMKLQSDRIVIHRKFQTDFKKRKAGLPA